MRRRPRRVRHFVRMPVFISIGTNWWHEAVKSEIAAACSSDEAVLSARCQESTAIPNGPHLPMETTMTERGFRVRGLGEIAIRCDDLERMTAFYGNVLGLERMESNVAEGIVFFRIADGFGGHTQVLALFDKQHVSRPGLHPTGIEAPATGASSSLHHLAFSLPYGEQEAVMSWYEAQGLPYRVETFGWVGWRGVFTEDPEGNTVELVSP